MSNHSKWISKAGKWSLKAAKWTVKEAVKPKNIRKAAEVIVESKGPVDLAFNTAKAVIKK